LSGNYLVGKTGENPDSCHELNHDQMSVILLLIPLSVVIAGVFLVAFIWAVRSGQFEDTCTPSMRLLTDERHPKNASEPSNFIEQ
jgi:cbb3-type cytochrome oxidase maturation protein